MTPTTTPMETMIAVKPIKRGSRRLRPGDRFEVREIDVQLLERQGLARRAGGSGIYWSNSASENPLRPSWARLWER